MQYSPAMKKEWEGFRPTMYWLNAPRVRGLGLIRVERTAAGEELATPVTMGDALDTACSQTITDIGWPKEGGPLLTQVTTETGELIFDGPQFNQGVLKLLLKFRQERIDPIDASWFWYDARSCMDEPMESYKFFVVYDDRIVREEVSFVDHGGSGFDPSILRAADVWLSPAGWTNEKEWLDAQIRFWYRKFYQETKTGQLMVLRTDEPELYHFPEGRSRPDSTLNLLQDQLGKTHSMLESGLGLVQRQLSETHALLRWVVFLLVALLVATYFGRR
jgi:hypothetical protein